MANVPVSPNVDRFPTRPGATYRLVGVASNAVSDGEIATLLGQLGLRSGNVWGARASAQALPSDWPAEGRPSVLVGEHLFRAQGTWQSNNALPTTLRLSDGTRAVLFGVWEVPSGGQNVALTTPPVTTTSAGPNKTLLAGSLVLAAGLFLGGLALVWNRKQGPVRNPMHEVLHYRGFVIKIYFEDRDWVAAISDPKDKEGYMPEMSLQKGTAIAKAKARIDKVLSGSLRKNPVRFEGTVVHRGVPLHVHQRDNGWCVDYSAVERYTPFGKGGTLCASSRARAITAAQRVIDPWLPKPGATARKVYVD